MSSAAAWIAIPTTPTTATPCATASPAVSATVKSPSPASTTILHGLNPIRQHTHVCSKCHEGAGASFALYRVHEPNPALLSTARIMPLLFYAFWIMVALRSGTFALFLPHTVLWGIRELFMKKGGGSGEP
jgi:hypothetical protein